MPETRPIVRAGVVLLVVAVVAVLGVMIALPFVGMSRLADAEGRWEDAGRPLGVFAITHPPRSANESALELERVARRVGLELAPFGASRRQRVVASTLPAREARAWVEAFVRGEASSPSAPPAGVADAFAREAGAWDEIVEHLLRQAPPLWRLASDGGLETSPSYDVGGAWQVLQRLDARALVAEHAGRAAEAERSLAAGWRLSAALAEEDWLHARVFIPILRAEQAILARRLDGVDAEAWLPRLGRGSRQRELARHLQANAAALLLTADRGELAAAHQRRSRPRGRRQRDPRGVGAALATLRSAFVAPSSAARHLEHLHGVVRAIDESAPCSAVDRVAALAPERESTWRASAPWNSSPLDEVARAWAADAQEELTAKVLEARASGGVIDEGWAHGACPEVEYDLERLTDGGFRVTTLHPPHRTNLGRLLDLPLTHEESP